jgi:hypothetical protein
MYIISFRPRNVENEDSMAIIIFSAFDNNSCHILQNISKNLLKKTIMKALISKFTGFFFKVLPRS